MFECFGPGRVNMKRVKLSLTWLCGLCFLRLTVSISAQDFTLHATPGGVEYGIWGTSGEKPAPTLMIFSGSIENTLSKPYFRQCGNALSEKGYLCVSIDLPCHGKEAIKGEPSGIAGWNHRIAKGENIVEEFQKRASEVLDHLIETKIADPNRIAAAGTSRGGFLAIQFAAHDERVNCVAGFAPVTNLTALREFAGNEELPLVTRLSLESQAKRLAGKPVWVIIGDRDERVSTRSAMDFAMALSSEAVAKDVPSQLELHVVSEPRGHTTPKGAAEQAAIWVHQKLAE